MRSRAVVLTLVITAAIAAACGGGSSKASSTGSTGSSSSTTAAAASSSGSSGSSSSSGSAKATISAGGKQFTFSGGTCTNDSGTLTVNIGTRPTAGQSAATGLNYFGLDVGPIPPGSGSGQKVTGDGTYPVAVMSANQGGSFVNATSATVVLSGGTKNGQISGTGTIGGSGPAQTGQPITGSFSC